MFDFAKLEENAGKNNLICPNTTCIGIPEILYSQNLLSSNIFQKCNSCQTKVKNVGKSEISNFLSQSSKIRCCICFSQIIHNFFCYYCTKCKNICHNFCDKNHQDKILQINYIYNKCLEHNSPFISRCNECNISLCEKCEDQNICKLIHHLVSFDKIVKSPDEIEQKIAAFEKQKDFLNKILEINQDIIQSLKDDINIKEKIITNYQNNKNNYESILNFNNLQIENNPKYEDILTNIISEYENAKNDNNSDINTVINHILCPLYFSLMVNQNKNIDCSVIKELEKIVPDNTDKKTEPENNNDNQTINNNDNQIISNNDNQTISNNDNRTISDNDKQTDSDNDNQTDNDNDNQTDNDNNNQTDSDNDSQTISNNDTQTTSNNNDNLSNNNHENQNNNNKNGNQSDNKDNENQSDIKSNENQSNTNKNNESQSDIKINENQRDNKINENQSTNNNNKNKGKNNHYYYNYNKYNKGSYQYQYNNNNRYAYSSYSNTNKKPNKNYFWENNNKNLLSVNYNQFWQKKKNIKCMKNVNSTSYKEIKNLQYKTKINNMIILKSGSIAISSYGLIEIYNKDLIYKSYKNRYEDDLLIKIELMQKKPISYMYQLPDETFLFSTFSKIFRIQLNEKYKNYDVLEFIKIEPSELVTKIISLGPLFIMTLSLHNKLCKLRLSSQINHYKYLIPNNNIGNNNPINSVEDNTSNENNADNKSISEDNNESENNINEVNDENNNSSISEEIQINKIHLESSYNPNNISRYFSVKDFFNNYSGAKKLNRKFEISHNLNSENISYTSLCEIKSNSNTTTNINNNDPQILHEFIAVSNSVIERGKDIIQFFALKSNNCYLNIAKTKKIENISCSIEPDSICQFNGNYICVGLQNFNITGQKSGYALIDITQKSITQIIDDNEIFYVNFNEEKNLLLAGMVVRNFEGFYNMIKAYNIQVDGNNKITFKTMYEFKSRHEGKIISIVDLESQYFCSKLLNSNFVCVSASVDGNIKIINSI